MTQNAAVNNGANTMAAMRGLPPLLLLLAVFLPFINKHQSMKLHMFIGELPLTRFSHFLSLSLFFSFSSPHDSQTHL